MSASDATTPAANVVLHIWPRAFGLASMEPTCLAAVLYLQLVIPGKFTLEESTTPDYSPSGQLPYLTHDLVTISSLPGIMTYVSGLPDSSKLDGHPSAKEKAQRTAWKSHAASTLGDLVAYSFYTSANYWGLIRPTLAKMMPIPQRYYVPNRIRELHKLRLEAVGLWPTETEEPSEQSKLGASLLGKQPSTKDPKEVARNTFALEQTLEKARAFLDTYTRLLKGRMFFYYERPSTLDIIVAAHTLLILSPSPPDPVLKDLIIESYPSIAVHARLVLSRAFLGPATSPLTYHTSSTNTWSALIPTFGSNTPRPEPSEVEKEFTNMRWGWVGLVIVSTIGYLWLNPLVVIVQVGDEDEGVRSLEDEEVGE
ncbi:hypothetical protein BJ322DRAFT_1102582 [Thelephora terrestris]|uniref:Mitochondrial outer membrane transport complex Sam37/metaxin N-terminal domain-containing protein n=1 Tax=Thelephora terrestris TaxID=56493 RepID=A0A9P6HPT7_9AGAM|nr:hypothetical protein BJ322DRAFT_1102582 [Thelephora terrestris]